MVNEEVTIKLTESIAIIDKEMEEINSALEKKENDIYGKYRSNMEFVMNDIVKRLELFDDEIFEKLATVNMSDEKYVYTMRWDGEQNFMLTNDCGEIRYKADANMSPEPEKIVTPATGPAENVLYIAIAAIILYGAYTIFFRKSENN